MSEQNDSKVFRRNVAVVVVNSDGLILACHRTDISGAWQLPQGGIESGETDEAALFRELEEEIGTREAEIIGKLPYTIRYDWPEHLYSRGYHGQEQTYFLVKLRPSAVLDLTRSSYAEFDRCEWLQVEEFLSRVNGFKCEAYRAAIAAFQAMFPHVIRSTK